MNNTENQQISKGTRIGSMFLDHFFMSVIAMAFFIPSIIYGISLTLKVSHDQTGMSMLNGRLAFIGMFGFALYFCKDSFNGRSIAKRMLKLQVVDNSSGEPASPLKCFIRNLFCILWPVEVIMALSDTSRRLGDRVAGTKLVVYDPAMEQPPVNSGRVILPLALSYGLLLLLIHAIPSPEQELINYSETSYNHTEAKDLEKILTDSLGQYMVPDIRIYDTIKGENLKYISVILQLRKNYMKDDHTYRELRDATMDLIYSKFPAETFTGHIQFIYQQPGESVKESMSIGAHLKPKRLK